MGTRRDSLWEWKGAGVACVWVRTRVLVRGGWSLGLCGWRGGLSGGGREGMTLGGWWGGQGSGGSRLGRPTWCWHRWSLARLSARSAALAPPRTGIAAYTGQGPCHSLTWKIMLQWVTVTSINHHYYDKSIWIRKSVIIEINVIHCPFKQTQMNESYLKNPCSKCNRTDVGPRSVCTDNENMKLLSPEFLTRKAPILASFNKLRAPWKDGKKLVKNKYTSQ